VLILIAGATCFDHARACRNRRTWRLWWRGMCAALGGRLRKPIVPATAVRVFIKVAEGNALTFGKQQPDRFDRCLWLFWILSG